MMGGAAVGYSPYGSTCSRRVDTHRGMTRKSRIKRFLLFILERAAATSQNFKAYPPTLKYSAGDHWPFNPNHRMVDMPRKRMTKPRP